MTAETRDGRHIMILRAWIDDTGDDSIFALGGLIGPLKVWDNFSRMWIKKLKERPRLGFYKTNYAMGLKRDFKGWSSDARNSKVAKLASCIPTRNCCGITSLLYRSDYDELVVGKCEFEPEFRSPYYVCALYLVAVHVAHSTERPR